MKTNLDIINGFHLDLLALHDLDWDNINPPLPHTTINQTVAMSTLDSRDVCDHDDCVASRFSLIAVEITKGMNPMCDLHRRIIELFRSALFEMAGKNIGNSAEDFLRDFPRDSY